MAATTRAKARASAVAVCAGCSATWKTGGSAHCASCHATFPGVKEFDAHRPKGSCLVIPADRSEKDPPACDQNGTGVILAIADSAQHNPEEEPEMAKHTEVRLIDDIDGGDADETLDFGLDGKLYDIDLSAKHAQEIRDFMEPYITAGRVSARTVKPKGTRGDSGGQRGRDDREKAKVIREWATSRGMKVSERGRIPSHVNEAYDQAHA